jgi:hypothetical protein
LRVQRGIKLRGRVLDDAGTPVRATVTATGLGTNLSAQTDANGNFEFGHLAAGNYRLHAELPGTYVASQFVDVDAGAQDVLLRVSRGATITGRAVDGGTGAGVQAELTLARFGEPRVDMTVLRSGVDGSFEFGGLKPGSYLITASTIDGRWGMLRAMDVDPLARIDGLRVALAPGASLRVRYDGQYVSGTLQILRDGALTTIDGVARGKPAKFLVPSGSVHLVFRAGGHQHAGDVTLAAGEERELVFKDED